MELLNTNLKWLRNTFSLSLKDLSKSLDIKISTLNSYEDNTFPRIDTLDKIVKWYSQAIPELTIDDVYNNKLEEKYSDANFSFFDELKSSSGYQTIKNVLNEISIEQLEVEKLRLETFNNMVKMANEKIVDEEVIKDFLQSFKLIVKDK